MKLIKNIILLLFSFSFLSFTFIFIDDEKEIKFEVISKGPISEKVFYNSKYFTIDNIFEYDEFWIHLTGNTTNKPYVNMNESRLIVFGGGGTIDKMSLSNSFINLYTTSIKSPPSKYITHGPPDPPIYSLIKIDYNSSPVKWFEQVIEAKEVK